MNIKGQHQDGKRAQKASPFCCGRELRAAQLLGERGEEDEEAQVFPCEADGTAAGVERSQQKAQAGRH